MRLSTIFLACSDSAAETVDSPIAKLNRLGNIATEIFSTDSVIKVAGRGRHGRSWGNRWKSKFIRSSDRMKNSFERCGTKSLEADVGLDEEYDIENPCEAIKQLTNGFTNWVNRHMSTCNGQKNHSHHEKRMENWQNLLHKGIGFDLFFFQNKLFVTFRMLHSGMVKI